MKIAGCGWRLRSGVGVLLGLALVWAGLALSGCGGSSSPVSVAVTAAASTVDPADTTTLSATVTNDKNSAGVTWTVTGGGTLSNTSTSAATFTAPAATASAQTVTVTATSVADTSKSGSATITVPAAVSVTTGALAAGAVGTAYSQALAATGGITPYAWTITTGTLPACLSINSAGVISGTPTASCAGTTNLTFKVTDAGTATAQTATSASLGLTINAAPAIVLPAGGALPGGTYNVAYSGSVAATGGAGTLSYSVSAGALPTGLGLGATGAITGTPTAAGTASFTIKASDAFGDSATQAYSITVTYPALTITTASLAAGYVGTYYSQTLAATGGAGGNTWSTNGAGTASLAAVNLSLSAAGVVSGTPAATGTATFAATVTDSASHTATVTYAIVVTNALTITTSSLPAAYTQTAYSQTLAATGGSGTTDTWSLSVPGNLSSFNLSLSAGGAITGTPTTSGTASFTAKVTDSASNTASQALTITVYNALLLPATNPSSLPSTATVGASYTGAITASGGSGNYSWTVTGLPSDSLISSSNGGTLSITGTPGSATTVSFTAKVTDTATGIGAGPFTYSIVVSNPAPLTLPSPNPTTLPSATVNQSYTGSINATGGVGPNYNWNVGGSSIPTNGTPITISNGITVSNTGGNTLTVGGTPTTTTTVTLTNVMVTDSASHTSSPVTYPIPVNSAGSTVSGQINLTGCGSALPGVTVSINTTPVQSTTTDSSGNYSFATVPNGNYTITPSITGPSSVFFPATLTARGESIDSRTCRVP